MTRICAWGFEKSSSNQNREHDGPSGVQHTDNPRSGATHLRLGSGESAGLAGVPSQTSHAIGMGVAFPTFDVTSTWRTFVTMEDSQTIGPVDIEIQFRRPTDAIEVRLNHDGASSAVEVSDGPSDDYLWLETTESGGTVTLYVNGVQIAQHSGQGYASLGGITLDGQANATLDVDDVILDSSGGRRIDAGRSLYFIEPTGNGATQQWANVGAGASPSARLTDNDSGTARQAAGSGAKLDQFTVDDHPGVWLDDFATPVAFYGSYQSGNLLDLGTWTARIYLGASNATTGNIGPDTLTTRHLFELVTETPPGGGDWTVQDIDDLVMAMNAGGGVVNQSTVQEVWGYLEVALQHDEAETATVTEAPLTQTEREPAESVTVTSVPVDQAEQITTDTITATAAPLTENDSQPTSTATVTEDAPPIEADVQPDTGPTITQDPKQVSEDIWPSGPDNFPPPHGFTSTAAPLTHAERAVTDTATVTEDSPPIEADQQPTETATVTQAPQQVAEQVTTDGLTVTSDPLLEAADALFDSLTVTEQHDPMIFLPQPLCEDPPPSGGGDGGLRVTIFDELL